MLAPEKYVHECGRESKLLRAGENVRVADQRLRLSYRHAQQARRRGARYGRKAVALVSQTHVPSGVYEAVRKHFSEKSRWI
jgi:hypothetical protein